MKRPLIRTPKVTSNAEVMRSLAKAFINDGQHFGHVKVLQTRRGDAQVYNIGHEDYTGIITADGYRQVHTVTQMGPQNWHLREDMRKLNEARPEVQFFDRPGDKKQQRIHVRVQPRVVVRTK